jgi:hypothetical protein
MTSNKDPALTQLRRLQDRLDRQTEDVERLESAGQDASQARQRLKLMQAAMKEMRIHLGVLGPTAQDDKRQPRPGSKKT